MSKKPAGFVQSIVSAFWKAAQALRGQPTLPPQPPRAKLDGRRGYGDDGIPSPDREHDP